MTYNDNLKYLSEVMLNIGVERFRILGGGKV